MKRNFRIYFVVAAVLVLVVFLIGSGLQDTMVYYVTVKELKAAPEGHEGRGLRVNGTVVAGSLVQRKATKYEFVITEDNEELTVHYDGILPDTFRENHDVLLEGKYLGNGVFEAQHVFTKCASKYDAGFEHPEANEEKS